MKSSFTKTTILFLCTALGLTIGVGSAFGQKLIADSQVKGEIPIDQPKIIPKKQLVPEHLKPKQEEKPDKADSQKVKGEKPVDEPRKRFEQRERLVPEMPKSEPEQPSSQEEKNDEKRIPEKQEKQEKPKESLTSDDEQNPKRSAPENSKGQQERTKQAPRDESPTEKQKTTNTNESSSKQQLPRANQQQETSSLNQKQQDLHESKEQEETNSHIEDGHEIQIPNKVEVESSDGRKVDVTSVIEDIFGEVHDAKEETEAIQKRMENEQLHPKVALQQPSHSTNNQSSKQIVEEPNDQYSVNNPPRTEQHGIMPMTASNDLHGVIIGLGMAAAGIFYVLFRKGE